MLFESNKQVVTMFAHWLTAATKMTIVESRPETTATVKANTKLCVAGDTQVDRYLTTSTDNELLASQAPKPACKRQLLKGLLAAIAALAHFVTEQTILSKDLKSDLESILRT